MDFRIYSLKNFTNQGSFISHFQSHRHDKEGTSKEAHDHFGSEFNQKGVKQEIFFVLEYVLDFDDCKLTSVT